MCNGATEYKCSESCDIQNIHCGTKFDDNAFSRYTSTHAHLLAGKQIAVI